MVVSLLTQLVPRKPINAISAYALSCQTGDEWVRSPLEILGNVCSAEREGMFRWICVEPPLLFLSD